MSIFRKIDLQEVQKNPAVKSLFLVWLVLSIITTLAFYYEIRSLHHIDVPTHIGAGMVITAFIYSAVKVKNGKQALALAFIPFLLWELIEIGIAGSAQDGSFFFRLFDETFRNRIQDLAMDVLGFFVFMIMTGRRF